MTNQIYDTLRQEVLECTLPPGAQLREKELASRFEVSKSPVREALQHLVREGLIVVLPRVGYRVSSVSASDARELFVFRRHMELACLEESARHADREGLARLDGFRSFDGSGEAFIAYNRAFHRALAECCGNARMARATADLIDEMDRPVRLSISAIEGRDPARLVAEHGAIIDAVQALDGRRAASLMRAHLTAAEKRFVTALEWASVRE